MKKYIKTNFSQETPIDEWRATLDEPVHRTKRWKLQGNNQPRLDEKSVVVI